MTVVVEYENGKKIYRSYGILGSSAEDREKADKLDEYLKNRVIELTKNFEKEGIILDEVKSGTTYIYWRLGKVLYKILFESGLVDPAEKSLLWLNAKIHIPTTLTKEDRGPERNHLEYCCRLGRFSKEKAEKMNWGEWVYLFDSPGINKEKRFDIWFEKKIDQKDIDLSRISIRVFVQCLNNMIGNIETADLSDGELFRCYNAAWELRNELSVRKKEIKSQELKQLNMKIKKGIRQNYTKVGDVMENKLTAQDFAKAVLNTLN